MITYKLFRVKNGNLYPLYVQADRKMPIGEWIYAEVGKKVDDTHVKAKGCGGSLSLRTQGSLIPVNQRKHTICNISLRSLSDKPCTKCRFVLL